MPDKKQESVNAYIKAQAKLDNAIQGLEQDLEKRESPWTRDSDRRKKKKTADESLLALMKEIKDMPYNEVDVGQKATKEAPQSDGHFIQGVNWEANQTKGLGGKGFKSHFNRAKDAIEACVNAAKVAQVANNNHFKSAPVNTAPFDGPGEMLSQTELARKAQYRAHAQKQRDEFFRHKKDGRKKELAPIRKKHEAGKKTDAQKIAGKEKGKKLYEQAKQKNRAARNDHTAAIGAKYGVSRQAVKNPKEVEVKANVKGNSWMKNAFKSVCNKRPSPRSQPPNSAKC